MKTRLNWLTENRTNYAFIDWGVIDERGRRVGHALYINPEYKGDGFEFLPQAMRGGRHFGAIAVNSRKVFANIDDAKQFAELWIRKTRWRVLQTAKKKGWLIELIKPDDETE